MNLLHRISLGSAAIALSYKTFALNAVAQTFGTGDFLGPVPDIGRNDGDVRAIIEEVIRDILTFMALLAVVVIVIAGIRLVLSGGNDEQKDGAKKMIIYAIVGLIIIILARVLVEFIIATVGGEG